MFFNGTQIELSMLSEHISRSILDSLLTEVSTKKPVLYILIVVRERSIHSYQQLLLTGVIGKADLREGRFWHGRIGKYLTSKKRQILVRRYFEKKFNPDYNFLVQDTSFTYYTTQKCLPTLNNGLRMYFKLLNICGRLTD